MEETMVKALSEDAGSTKAGASLLIVSSIILLVVQVWHPKGAPALSGTALAEAIVAAPGWAEMHLLGSFALALSACAFVILLSRPGLFGTGADVRASLSILSIGSLVGSIGFVIDGQRAYIAPAVVRGQDLALFNALTLLWDDRGLGVHTFVLLGVGAAILAAAQLRAPTLAPRWASALALVGAVMAAGFGFFVFELRIFPLQMLAIGGAPAYGWLILVGALALKRLRSATAEAQVATQ